MKDEKKTKRQLINELQEMRQRVAELETLDTDSSFTEKLIRHAQDFADGIVQTVREPLLVLDSDLRVISANLSFYRNFQVSPEETENQFIFELGNHQWDIPRLRELLEEILSKDTHFNDFEVSHNFLTVGHRTMLLNARQIHQEGIGTSKILLAIEDITNQKRAEKVMRLAQKKMEQQLEIARVIQQSFLPTYLPGDDDPRFRLAAVNHPAAVVGGDYYDVIPLGHDRLGIVICDVSGKGVPGAIYMARLVSDFRLLVDPHEGTPAETLTELNRILLERGPPGMFVTLLYIMLNLDTGVFTFANAGHPPILVRRVHGAFEVVEGFTGPPLSIIDNPTYVDAEIALAPGEDILLFTDGATETMNPVREQFGRERLMKILKSAPAQPKALVTAVVEAVRSFAGDAPAHDDLTILAARWEGGDALML